MEEEGSKVGVAKGGFVTEYAFRFGSGRRSGSDYGLYQYLLFITASES